MLAVVRPIHENASESFPAAFPHGSLAGIQQNGTTLGLLRLMFKQEGPTILGNRLCSPPNLPPPVRYLPFPPVYPPVGDFYCCPDELP